MDEISITITVAMGFVGAISFIAGFFIGMLSKTKEVRDLERELASANARANDATLRLANQHSFLGA